MGVRAQAKTVEDKGEEGLRRGRRLGERRRKGPGAHDTMSGRGSKLHQP